jgi:hypothetical protein
MCTVHYNCAPVTTATPHIWNQNSLVVQIMFITSHEIEHLFSNKAQSLVYQQLRRRTKGRLGNTRSVADCSKVHSPSSQPPHFFTPLTIFKIIHFSATFIFVITAHICTTMMRFDHDKLLPPFVKLTRTSPCCTNIGSQYNGNCSNNNSKHGARYNHTCSARRSQRTHLSTVNVHKDRLIDSVAQPMSHGRTYTSPSLVHLCNNRPADIICIVSYIGRQYARTVPNVDIVGSRNVILQGDI